MGRHFLQTRLSFTLVELLVVVGILAVLSVAVVTVLNPLEYIKQSRDAKRISDVGAINKALSVLEVQGSSSFGSPYVVYTSLSDDASSTCGSLGLPPLPVLYTYHCVSSSTLRNTDGTGWIPVNFQSAMTLSFASLPIDPVNTTSTGSYYTYMIGTGYEITAYTESSKYLAVSSRDGDSYLGVYSKRTSRVPLTPGIRERDLAGYWPLDEGPGQTAYDISGNRNNGTWSGTGIRYSNAGKIGYAGSFNGVDDYITLPTVTSLSDSTFCAWVSSNVPATLQNIIGGNNNIFSYVSVSSRSFQIYDGAGWRIHPTVMSTSTWYFSCATFAGATRELRLYLDGILGYSGSGASSYSNAKIQSIGRYSASAVRYWNGTIDDVRVYSRVLSAEEIQSIYSATK